MSFRIRQATKTLFVVVLDAGQFGFEIVDGLDHRVSILMQEGHAAKAVEIVSDQVVHGGTWLLADRVWDRP